MQAVWMDYMNLSVSAAISVLADENGLNAARKFSGGFWRPGVFLPNR